jgi:hypothetical protein
VLSYQVSPCLSAHASCPCALCPLQALNVVPESGPWDACDTAVNNDFKYDFMKGFHQVSQN